MQGTETKIVPLQYYFVLWSLTQVSFQPAHMFPPSRLGDFFADGVLGQANDTVLNQFLNELWQSFVQTASVRFCGPSNPRYLSSVKPLTRTWQLIYAVTALIPCSPRDGSRSCLSKRVKPILEAVLACCLPTKRDEIPTACQEGLTVDVVIRTNTTRKASKRKEKRQGGIRMVRAKLVSFAYLS